VTDALRAEIITAVGQTGPAAAMRVLQLALTLATEALPTEAPADGGTGDGTAIETVIALDDALVAAGDLRRRTPALLAAADSGPAVDAFVRDRLAEVTELTGRVGDARATLTALRQAEQDVAARLAELGELRAEVARLRRQEMLARALTELDAQRTELTARADALAGRTAGIEEDVRRGATTLIRVSGEQLAALAEPVRRALSEAAAAEDARAAALAELTAAETRSAAARTELQQAMARSAELRAEQDDRLAALAAHTEANQRIAEALQRYHPGGPASSALTGLRALLDETAARLSEIDTALAGVLDERDTRHRTEHTVRAWTGR
jgi:chromosome segregation ATPase